MLGADTEVLTPDLFLTLQVFAASESRCSESRLCGRLRIHKRRYEAFFDLAGANAIPAVQMYFPKLLIVYNLSFLNFVLLALAVQA